MLRHMLPHNDLLQSSPIKPTLMSDISRDFLSKNIDSFESLESIVRVKEAEARMCQIRTDEARNEAETYNQMGRMRAEKLEEEYAEKLGKVCLQETEEKRRKKMEELKVLESSHCDYYNMKMRMQAEIAGLLERMEATRKHRVQLLHFVWFSWLKLCMLCMNLYQLNLSLALQQCPMDAITSGTSTLQYHNLAYQPIVTTIKPSTPQVFEHQVRQCLGNSTPGDFPLAARPSIVLHVLTTCSFNPQDLAKIEATCSFLRQPAGFAPDYDLLITELCTFVFWY